MEKKKVSVGSYEARLKKLEEDFARLVKGIRFYDKEFNSGPGVLEWIFERLNAADEDIVKIKSRNRKAR